MQNHGRVQNQMTNGKTKNAKRGFIELLAAAIILAAAVLCGFVRPAAASAEALRINTETVLLCGHGSGGGGRIGRHQSLH